MYFVSREAAKGTVGVFEAKFEERLTLPRVSKEMTQQVQRRFSHLFSSYVLSALGFCFSRGLLHTQVSFVVCHQTFVLFLVSH